MTDDPIEAVVIDTMVFSWLLDDRPNSLADRYRSLIGRSSVLVSFHTVMELRFGSMVAGWGDLRRRRLDRSIAGVSVVQPDDEMLTICAQLRTDCRRAGHALGDKVHDGDRWVTATALRLRVPLVSHDGIFVDAPGLQLITVVT